MYIQVTTKCNMACKHCMFSCRPGIGRDMPLSIFKKAIDLAATYDSYVTIGGGEPTLHPKLLWMLGYAGLVLGPEKMFMVTNGTCSSGIWKSLMHARESKMLSIAVSDDPWHNKEMRKEWVEDDAEQHNLWWGTPDSRNKYSRRILVLQGRAKDNINELEKEAYRSGYVNVERVETDCSDPRIDPDGIVWADVYGKIGLLNDGNISKAYDKIREYEEEQANHNYYKVTDITNESSLEII